MSLQIGDIVGRKSYGYDVHFRIVAIDKKRQEAELKGVDMRLWADAPLSDLRLIDQDTRGKKKEREEEQTSSSIKELKQRREQGDLFFELPGRVLHIDGDPQYLKKCLTLYKELYIPAYGIHVPEHDMPEHVTSLLNYIRPDVLVLTGHDAYHKSKGTRSDLNAYRHSSYFKEAVQKAREYEPNRDQLIIFAGACQSYFEALLQSGANFASSPGRINIHALDPVYIVEKACYTAVDKLINIDEVIQHSITGSSGIGGIDTRGTYRRGKPKPNLHSF